MAFLLGCEKVSVEFPTKTVFEGLSLGVDEGARIGIVGQNGDGKSTLLRVLSGDVEVDDGRVIRTRGVSVGVLGQSDDLRDADTVERAVVGDIPEYEWAGDPRVRAIIAGLLEDVDWNATVGTLSGGQRRRVDLARLLIGDWDVLMLDEPTNHLDVSSREWIEEAVEAFDGALLFVSHDRYFINRFAQRIWILENGKITDFRGDYEALRAKQAREEELRSVLKPAPVPKAKQPKPKAPGGTKNLEKQLRTLERDIAKAEEHISELDSQMEVNACDYQKLQELSEEKAEAEEALNGLYERWEELSLQLEELQS